MAAHGLTEADASRYFEKLVQIPFQLPPLGAASIRAYLQDLAPEVSATFAQIIEAIPRALKRSYQVYSIVQSLCAHLLARWQIDPLEPELIAEWLTLQMRYPELAEIIARRPAFLLSLEIEALKRAGQAGRLGTRDTRIVTAAADPLDPGVPPLDAIWPNVTALLLAGSRRFNQRIHRETLESYIYLGGTSGRLDAEVRSKSRERQVLLWRDEGERQQLANQLLLWPLAELKVDGAYVSLLHAESAAQKYLKRLSQALEKSGVLDQDELKRAPAAKAALDAARPRPDGTVYVPMRAHVFGSPPDWLVQAATEDSQFDKELMAREEKRPPAPRSRFPHRALPSDKL